VEPDLDAAEVSSRLLAGLQGRQRTVEKHGRGAKGLADGAMRAVYEVPHLEHAPLEPMNCTVLLTGDRVDIWAGTQAQTLTFEAATAITGLPERKVHIHTELIGGGFGRRGNVDFIEQALHIATRMPGVPVQVVWSREECMQHGWYRPAAAARLRGHVAGGRVVALDATLAVDNVVHRYLPRLLWGLPPVVEAPMEGLVHDGMPYQLEHYEARYAQVKLPVPIGFWRSVGHSYSAFFVESFLDELAAAHELDPVEVRRRLLAHSPRHLAVLEAAVQAAGWGEAAEGRVQGVALHCSFGSICAEVVELEAVDGWPVVHRITAAIDCGRAVHPDAVRAQLMGGALFGLSEALYGGLVLQQGRVVNSNFHDYPLLRMSEAPEVQAVIVDSGEALGGVGEVAVPPLAPALCNAWFAATGQRVRQLPLSRALERSDKEAS
jgi:isoquinoline 1-oxidoreductase beta subunit